MKSQFNILDMQESLQNRHGEFDAIRQVMRDRLNKRGDRVMLRVEEVRYILDSFDYFKDTIYELQKRKWDLEHTVEDNPIDG